MNPNFKVGSRSIGPQNIFLIAEAGVNHNGSLELALQMIDAAAAAGADAVKFQSFQTSELIIDGVAKAPYQKKNSGSAQTQTQMLKALEIDRCFHVELIRRCRRKRIIFLSTPYDDPSLKLLAALKVPALKISSTDATNLLFLEKAAALRIPVILSTGMCTLNEIKTAHRTLIKSGCVKIALLKCTTDYPASPNQVNLAGIRTLMSEFPDCVIGFSDHTRGSEVSVWAAAAGARIIEKHFTLDKSLAGPDHKASMGPAELCQWVSDIRRVEASLGSGRLEPSPAEMGARKTIRRFLVLARNVKKGARLTKADLGAKRTGGKGIRAEDYRKVEGRRIRRALEAGTILNFSDVM